MYFAPPLLLSELQRCIQMPLSETPVKHSIVDTPDTICGGEHRCAFAEVIGRVVVRSPRFEGNDVHLTRAVQENVMGFDSPIEKVPSLDSTREQKSRDFLRFEISLLPDPFELERASG